MELKHIANFGLDEKFRPYIRCSFGDFFESRSISNQDSAKVMTRKQYILHLQEIAIRGIYAAKTSSTD